MSPSDEDDLVPATPSCGMCGLDRKFHIMVVRGRT
jgi:hypothetical protein